MAVGPPYQMREKLDAASPAWTAVRLLDASIEKAELWMHRIGPNFGASCWGKFGVAVWDVFQWVKNTPTKTSMARKTAIFF